MDPNPLGNQDNPVLPTQSFAPPDTQNTAPTSLPYPASSIAMPAYTSAATPVHTINPLQSPALPLLNGPFPTTAPMTSPLGQIANAPPPFSTVAPIQVPSQLTFPTSVSTPVLHVPSPNAPSGSPAPPASLGQVSAGNGTDGGTAPTSSLPHATDTSTVDRIVLEYLRKRGFKAAESALWREVGPEAQVPANIDASSLALPEAEVDDDLRNVLMLLQNPSDLVESDVLRYEDSFRELLAWVDGSLDIYKPQLHAVLYPLFIHCFIEIIRRDHPKEGRAFLEQFSAEFCVGALGEVGGVNRRPEIISLKAVGSPQHLEENETTKLYLTYRYEVYLSQYAFELLMSFLTDDPRRTVLLRILNQRCRIHLDASGDGPPIWSSGLSKDSSDGKRKLTGILPDDERGDLPSGDILWGRLKPEQFTISDEELYTKSNAAGKGKQKLGSSEPKTKANSSDKNKGDGGKKDATGGGTVEEEEEAVVLEDGTISRSRVPLRRYCVGAATIESPAEIKSRANLRVADAVNGIRKDLSILFYTFVNTRDEGLNSCMISEDGAQIAAGFGDASVRLWDAKATGTSGSDAAGLGGRPVRLIGHSGPVYTVDWSKCSRYVLSGSGDGAIRLWSTTMKTDLVAYRSHNFPVWCARFSPLDHYFISGSHDRTGRIWTTDRVYPLRILAGHLADVDAVEWHPNCNYVATGSSDRSARLWDIRDGSCARIMHGSGPIYSLAFSPDGATLACAGDGRTIDIWDLRKCEKMLELVCHESTVWSLNYSRDGSVLASGGADQVVAVWRAEDWSTPITVELASINNGTENGGSAPATETKTIDSNGNKDGAGTDADGDVKMEAQGTDGAEKESTAADNVRKKGSTVRKSNRLSSHNNHGGVPLVEKFKTKQTPVQLVKFTRKNLLVAAGSFAT